MNIVNNLEQIQKILQDRFLKSRKSVRKNIALGIMALIKSESCSLPEIAVQMSSINNCTAASNELRISRFLKSKEFQIDDPMWRDYVALLFDLLKEVGFLKNGKTIAINVDYTSSTDEFSILSASIPYQGRALPLYFSMRLYPKKKGDLNQIKMEEAFIKALEHLLSNKYKFVIVADRGFGNQRFVNLCEDHGFDFIVRTKDNLKVLENEFSKVKKIKDLPQESYDFAQAIIVAWNKQIRLIKASSKVAGKSGKDNIWHIVTSLDKATFSSITKQYGYRFKCEKMFQDQKSSGFKIENSKIEKYDRFKKLLYLVSLTQMLMMFIGDYIDDNVDEIKKKFQLHIALISAFSR